MNDKIPVSIPPEQKRSCGTCQFSVAQLAQGPQGEPIIGQEQLACMRRPPQIVAITQKTPLGESTAIMTQFPPVTPEMYCFDYWPKGESLVDPELLDLISGEVMDD